MNIWKKGDGMQFANSAVCQGETFIPADTPVDLAAVHVTGRYPDSGYIYNEQSHEAAYVSAGSGYFQMKGGDWQAITVGDVVYFAPLERVAWKADDMTVVIACSPQFNPDKHHEETHDEI